MDINMEEQIYFTELYDYYGCLLTEKQQTYFEDYYFHNLTLSEMSDNYNISRNAIDKQILSVIDKLKFYEEKLKLYQKGKKIKQIIKEQKENWKELIEEYI